MSFFDLLKKADINEAVERYRQETNAVLLDVRTEEEYAEGHIEGSMNIPLPVISTAKQKINNRSVPIYTYCLSGARSRQNQKAG